MSDTSWYSVRCVFRLDPLPHEEVAPGSALYEERITLWKGRSLDDSISQAEAEAHGYEARVGATYLGFAQAYELADDAGNVSPATEVFSLMRESALAPSAYLERFFATGSEREQVDSDIAD